MRHVMLRLASGLLLLIASATASLADAFTDALAGFRGNTFADTEATIDRLVALGDPRGLAVLEALQDSRLYLVKPDGRILLQRAGSDGTFVDPVTGATVDKPAAGDADRLRINNRLRNQLKAAIGRFGLSSQDPNQRLAAVGGLLRDRSGDALGALQQALTIEKDARVAEAMRFGVAMLELAGNDQSRKLDAIRLLATSLDSRARQILGETAATSTDPEIREAAQNAIAKIERWRVWIDVAVNLYQGLSLGSILLLAAIGLAITFGVMGVINMAHGEMLMLGAYATFVTQELFRAFLPPSLIDWYLVAAVPAAALIAGAAGLVVERTIIRFLYGRPLETLLATWGLALVLQQAVRSLFGPTNREVANPSWMTGGIELVGGAVLTWNRLIIIAFCLAVLAGVWAILRHSRFGLEMRAVTQNRRMAASMGINTGRVDALTFALGSAVAGMGGVALSQVGNVSPNLGTLYIVDSFMVVVFGGVGQLAGTFVGAMTLGVANKLLEPMAGAVLGKVVLLVLLILFIQKRPQGLFVLKGRGAEA